MYILEGNIGVGKSTFLELLHQNCPDITVIQEPKDNWATHVYGQSLLGNFYQDPKRWAYTIETLTMISRVKDHTCEEKKTDPNRIMERSVYSGHYCFARNDYALGYLSEIEWDMYSKWADFLVHNSCKPPHGFIYLRAQPEVCHQRMISRGRKGEEEIPLTYVQQIHDWHEKFLITKEDLAPQIKEVPVLVLDAQYNLLTDRDVLLRYVQEVKDFIARTQD